MPANVEIKARVQDLDQLVRNAERLSGSPGAVILQTDTFFPVPHGRLKLRDLQAALSQALGVQGTVKKERHLYLVGQTRVHVDCVEGLGNFMELEVVLQPEQSLQEGEEVARQLMTELGVQQEDLLSGAYLDLLLAGGQNSP